jgi:hypothetical protein
MKLRIRKRRGLSRRTLRLISMYGETGSPQTTVSIAARLRRYGYGMGRPAKGW